MTYTVTGGTLIRTHSLASMLAVTETRGRHKQLLPQCSKRSQSKTNPPN